MARPKTALMWQTLHTLPLTNVKEILAMVAGAFEEHGVCCQDPDSEDWIPWNEFGACNDKDFWVKFDTGEMCKYSQENWPFAEVTHYKRFKQEVHNDK